MQIFRAPTLIFLILSTSCELQQKHIIEEDNSTSLKNEEITDKNYITKKKEVPTIKDTTKLQKDKLSLKVKPNTKALPKPVLSIEKKVQEARFSDELLKAVNNWNTIPKSVFPLKNISIKSPVVFRLLGPQNQVIATSKQPIGTEVVGRAFSNGQLLISPSLTSKLQAKIPLNETDFKQCVAFRFEMGKEILKMRAQKLKSKNKSFDREHTQTTKNAKGNQSADSDDLLSPGDFGHGKFCICSNCRKKRLAEFGSMK